MLYSNFIYITWDRFTVKKNYFVRNINMKFEETILIPNIIFELSQVTKVRNFLKFSSLRPDLKNFRGISREQVLVTDSSDIRKKIGHQFYGLFQRNFSRRNFWEFLKNNSPEIPEKFSVLGHQLYGFYGELNKRHSL